MECDHQSQSDSQQFSNSSESNSHTPNQGDWDPSEEEQASQSKIGKRGHKKAKAQTNVAIQKPTSKKERIKQKKLSKNVKDLINEEASFVRKEDYQNMPHDKLVSLVIRTSTEIEKLKKEKFYREESYTTKHEYIKLIKDMSEILAKKSEITEQQNSIYNTYLRKTVYMAYLKQAEAIQIHVKSDADDFSNLQACSPMAQKFYLDLINNKQLKLSLFKFDDKYEPKIRLIMLTTAIKDFRKMCSEKKIIQKISKKLTEQQRQRQRRKLVKQQARNLTELTVMPSFLNDNKKFFEKAHEFINSMRQSEFIAYMYSIYFTKMRSHYKTKLKFDVSVSRIKQATKEMEIVFMDSANFGLQGVTYSDDPQKIHPIFVNMMEFRNKIQKEDKRRVARLMCIYLFVVIMHELQHYLIRKLEIIKRYQQSNPFAVEVDGGGLFEMFLFCDKVQRIYQEDYQLIVNVLKLKCQQLENFNFEEWIQTSFTDESQVSNASSVENVDENYIPKCQKDRQDSIEIHKKKIEELNNELKGTQYFEDLTQNKQQQYTLEQTPTSNGSEVADNRQPSQQKKERKLSLKDPQVPFDAQVKRMLEELMVLGKYGKREKGNKGEKSNMKQQRLQKSRSSFSMGITRSRGYKDSGSIEMGQCGNFLLKSKSKFSIFDYWDRY